MLRPGNVHSAHNWREVLDPIVARYGRTGVRRYFRADAAFAKPEVYEYLEERRVLYAIRLPSNEVLQWEIAPLLRRPVGRPPKKPIIWYDDFWYQAGSWDRPRRVIAKVEWHQGELFPRVGFIVTNMSAGPEGVVHSVAGHGNRVRQRRLVSHHLDALHEVADERLALGDRPFLQERLVTTLSLHCLRLVAAEPVCRVWLRRSRPGCCP